MLANNPKKLRGGTEAELKKHQRAQEAEKAMSDYVAAGHAVHAKTARLKELRLAKEAAQKETKIEGPGVIKIEGPGVIKKKSSG
jgi:hypothetical protein